MEASLRPNKDTRIERYIQMGRGRDQIDGSKGGSEGREENVLETLKEKTTFGSLIFF